MNENINQFSKHIYNMWEAQVREQYLKLRFEESLNEYSEETKSKVRIVLWRLVDLDNEKRLN